MSDELLAELLERCTFREPGRGPLDCAVSGGADSTALLALAVAAGFEVTAHHVDHGLRPGSADEADVVRRTATALGASFVAHRVTLAGGPGLEARARAARRHLLPPHVCTGHTADDQAETVLLNLVRGAGTAGLAGMRDTPVGCGAAAHPILALRRHDTERLCAALGLEVVRDPTNDGDRFTRNRIRHHVLPLLSDVAARDVTPILVRQAGLVREDDDLLTSLAAVIDPTDARSLAAAPPPLARRAVRRWLAVADVDGHPPDAAAVERVLDVARGSARACEVAGGWRVERRRQVLTLRRADCRAD